MENALNVVKIKGQGLDWIVGQRSVECQDSIGCGKGQKSGAHWDCNLPC